MRKKNYKGRCEKQSLEKFTTICKTYDPIQSAYANILVKNKDVAEVRCNVPLDGDECGEYMSGAGFEGFIRGERGSTAEHLSSLEYKVKQDEKRLSELQDKIADRKSVV